MLPKKCFRRESLLLLALAIYICILLYTFSEASVQNQHYPPSLEIEQIHLAYDVGDLRYTGMFLSWSLTLDAECVVTYSLQDSVDQKSIYPKAYGLLWDKVLYRVSLKSLDYDTEYVYLIDCKNDQIQVIRRHSFRSSPGLKDGVSLLIVGDWATAGTGDANNPQHTLVPKPNILAPILLETGFDGIWHLGDLAYDLFSNRGTRGDQYLKDLEPLSAKNAYMPVVGNHEIGRFFQDYMQRFALPGAGLYWSLGFGKAQIIAISSEFDYNRMKPELFPRDQSLFEKLKFAQIRWLESELSKAEANRAVRPWIIVMAHKPMYCSMNPASEMIKSVCGVQAQVMREVYEDIMLAHGVDLLLFGHVHLYERLLPMTHGHVVGNYSLGDKIFINPKAPIHIINGVAGNLENPSVVMTVTETPGEWSAYMSESLGYGRLSIINNTHLHYEQFAFGETQFDPVDSPLEKRLEDEIWIVKNREE